MKIPPLVSITARLLSFLPQSEVTKIVLEFLYMVLTGQIVAKRLILSGEVDLRISVQISSVQFFCRIALDWN